MEKSMTLNFTLKPISYEKINEQFSKMRCYVMALGKNRNYSHFTQEAVQNALPTLYNIPVVAHLMQKDNGELFVGAHDSELVISDKIILRDLTVPFGVVPETNNIEFVEVTEKSGAISTYLVCDIILWTGRYPDIMEAIYSDDIYFNESMEIDDILGEPLKDDKRYTDIQSFIFSALTLLGKSDEELYHSEPCFPSSSVRPIQYNLETDKFKTEFALMKSELQKLAFSFENNQKNKEGGIEPLNEKIELLAKYNLTVEQIDFSIDDISIEDLETKLKDNYSEQNPEPEKVVVEFSATYRQKRDALNNALDPIVVKDADGNITNETYYWVSDFDDTYVFVEKYYWDASNSESTNGRFSYTFDDTAIQATITGEFEEMIVTWLTKEENQKIQDERASYETLKTDFDSYKTSYATPETEVEELRTFKSNQIKVERDEAEQTLFSQFDEKLSGVEEYEEFKKNASQFEISDLEDKCLVLFARKTMNFSAKPKTNKTVKIPVDNTQTNDDAPYGGIFNEYGKVGN